MAETPGNDHVSTNGHVSIADYHFPRKSISRQQLLILACGNPLRWDDGAGLLLAELLVPYLEAAGYRVRLVTVQQFVPELALEIANPRFGAVLFVDTIDCTNSLASAETAPQIQIQPLSATLSTPSLGHHLTPHQLLLYARTLYHSVPPAWLITIPGIDYRHGEGRSGLVQTLLAKAETVSQQLRKLLPQTLTTH